MKRFLLTLAIALASIAPTLALAADKMVEKGTPYFPLVTWAFDTAWPDAPMRSFVAAQAEKESLWNPRAELCVPKPTCARERGLGLGQFTITAKFNAFQEVSQMHPLLKGWAPKDYLDPKRQILAMVVKDRMHYRQCAPLMDGTYEVMACVASSYNGGFGGFSQDRRLCGNTQGCDPRKWFNNVAETSLKAKVPLSGYGDSFYTINRRYAHALVLGYRLKYVPHLGS